MMKKSYIFFVLILTNLFGQSFTGLIKDISGEPVSYVIIEEINSNIEEKNWAISDLNGFFTINVQNNSQLSFQRVGFKKISLEINEIEGKSNRNRSEIELKSKRNQNGIEAKPKWIQSETEATSKRNRSKSK